MCVIDKILAATPTIVESRRYDYHTRPYNRILHKYSHLSFTISVSIHQMTLSSLTRHICQTWVEAVLSRG